MQQAVRVYYMACYLWQVRCLIGVCRACPWARDGCMHQQHSLSAHLIPFAAHHQSQLYQQLGQFPSRYPARKPPEFLVTPLPLPPPQCLTCSLQAAFSMTSVLHLTLHLCFRPAYVKCGCQLMPRTA